MAGTLSALTILLTSRVRKRKNFSNGEKFSNGDCFCYCYCFSPNNNNARSADSTNQLIFLPWRARSCMHDSVGLMKKKWRHFPGQSISMAKNRLNWQNLEGFELELTGFQLLTWPLLFRSRVERRDFAYDRAMVSS
jgi:hypothetical protein